jgi:hypothetical protein
MFRILLALAFLLTAGAYATAADDWSQVRVWINNKAPYTVTLKRGGKTIATATGQGSKRVRLDAVGGDVYCIKFNGGYRIKGPGGKFYDHVCNPMYARYVNWQHKNVMGP